MITREQLQSIRSTANIQRLFVEELNYQSSTGSALGAISSALKENVKGADIIASLNDFRIVHCQLNKLYKGDERRIVEQLAASHDTRHSLVIFSDVSNSEFHFTNLRSPKKEKDLSVQPFRRIVVGPNERLRTAAERLSHLAVRDDDSALMIHVKCDEAFDVEAVSRAFYKDFVEQYKNFRAVLMKRNHLQQQDADVHTQTIFNRIFFLYFIQKMGYLNGDPTFLYNAFNDVGKKNYYQEIIIPLFKKLSIYDFNKSGFENIPFLNGGLFEFLEKEEELDIPNSAFDSAFEQLFEHYNFTIREDTEFEKEVAIDPEMMGTIFEQLILSLESKEFKDIPDPRRATGSYYTPKFIVAFKVKTVLMNYLLTNVSGVSRTQLKQLVFNLKINSIPHDNLQEIKERLKKVKIIDPAVGSGAYAVGALLKIVEIIETIDREIASQEVDKTNYRYNLKRYIIENCIYGVDIQKRAVGLATLRLWLSLIVDLQTKDIKRVPPLPNLDYHILCGDSLVSEVIEHSFDEIRKADLGMRGTELLEEFRKEKEKYSDLITSNQKEKSRAKIEKLKTEIIKRFLMKLIEKEERQIEAIEGEHGLFSEDEVSRQRSLNLAAPIRERIQILEQQLIEVKTLSGKFNWGLDFFDVIELQGGFDIAIANPPYGVKVSDEVRTMFGVESKDSYGVFTVLGLRILKPGGTLCYIMSDTWQTIKSHKKLRDILLSETEAQYLISCPPDTFGATVNTGVYVFVKRASARKKLEDDANNWLLAADFSPLKIRQHDGKWDPTDLETAFELLIEHDDRDDTKDGYTIESNHEFAVFAYKQKLIPRFSNHSFFIASPKLFALMRDVGNVKNELEAARGEAAVYAVEFNGKEVEIVKFGSVAEVKHGMTTGDNSKYIYKVINARGNYTIVDKLFVLPSKDFKNLSTDEKHWGFDPKNYNGKFLVPCDKGGESDTEDGWLPQYFVNTQYYLDWSRKSVKQMSKLIGHRHDNPDYYFRFGITFSPTGIYSPSFRISSGGISEHKGSCIYPRDPNYLEFILGVLNAKIVKYLVKNYIQHNIETGEESIKKIPFLVFEKNNQKIITTVESIINAQKIKNDYDYMTNEQVEIDRLVYQMYNLNKEDIAEVENWYWRRYPKLAKAIEEKMRKKNNDFNPIVS